MRSIPFLTFCSVCSFVVLLAAQTPTQSSTPPATPAATPAPPAAKKETVAKPMTDKQKKKQEEKLRKELETPYRKWLNEEVVYIISDEEKKTFHGLATDEEREQF